jgi:colanic acid biosynthesis glycosyl transferase WcaI
MKLAITARNSGQQIDQKKRKLKILIQGLNYAPEQIGIAVYTSGLAERLAQSGHKVEIVAGKPYYPTWRVFDGYKRRWFLSEKLNGVDVCRVAHYVPKRPTGLKRLVHHFSFVLSSFLPLLHKTKQMRPDVIFSVAPSLMVAPTVLLAGKLFGSKTWLHIQDFEVEAAIATGLLKPNTALTKLAKKAESWIVKNFDMVSTISPAMRNKCIEKSGKWERTYELRNWANDECFKKHAGPSRYSSEWDLEGKTVLLYSGNIGNKQGIEIIVDAARALQSNNELVFVICGDGPNKVQLQSRAAGLSNIVFKDLQPVSRLPELMQLADIHLLPQIAGASDLMLPSKLTNILASGRPVIATCEKTSGLGLEIDGCGLCVGNHDANLFYDAIRTLSVNHKLLTIFGQRAYERAEKNWRFEQVFFRFERALLDFTDIKQ